MQGRVSPVFDVATKVLLVDIEGAREVKREEKPLIETAPAARAAEVATLGCDVLICCAISWPLKVALVSSGMEVIACRSGPVEDILDAFIKGRLTDQLFLMPGCSGRRRRFRGGGGPDGTGPFFRS